MCDQPWDRPTRAAMACSRKSSALGSDAKWSIQRATPKRNTIAEATVEPASHSGGSRCWTVMVLAWRIGAVFSAPGRRFSSVDRRFQRDRFQPLPDRGQEARRLQPVEHAVVEREAQVHHRLDPDHPLDPDWA